MRTRILMALLLACGMVHASEWASVGNGNDGKETFVDLSSIRITGPVRRAWTKMVVLPHTVEGDGPHAGKWLSYLASYYAFNCADATSRSEAMTYYFDDGTNGSIDASFFPMQWEPVPPDTAWDTEMKRTCAHKPQ
jgi:hypothetical protein